MTETAKQATDGPTDRASVDVLGGRRLTFIVRPGFPSWSSIDPASRLLAKHAVLGAQEHVLISPCGHGALGVWAASAADPQAIQMMDTNWIAVQTARETTRANGWGTARVELALPSPSPEPFDVALLRLPKGRMLAQLHLLHAHAALRPGGRLYLAGPNKGGIKSVIRDAHALFGQASLLGYGGHSRVVVLVKNHTKTDALPRALARPGMRRGSYQRLEMNVMGCVLGALTRPGVFSWRHLDPGTRLLLENLRVEERDRIVDLGCGYGALGMFAVHRAANVRASLVDVDLLACECARASVALNRIPGVEVVLGDGQSALMQGSPTLVISNPPFHSGHPRSSSTAERWIRASRESLSPGGRLVIVANRFLPYDRLLRSCFGAVEVLADDRRYRVLSAQRAI